MSVSEHSTNFAQRPIGGAEIQGKTSYYKQFLKTIVLSFVLILSEENFSIPSTIRQPIFFNLGAQANLFGEHNSSGCSRGKPAIASFF